MVQRIYVYKKPGFDIAARGLRKRLERNFSVEIDDLIEFIRYDVEGITESQFAAVRDVVFAEPPVDETLSKLPKLAGYEIVRTQLLDGQFDLRAESASQCIQFLLLSERPLVRVASVYAIKFSGVCEKNKKKQKSVCAELLSQIKAFLINPIEKQEAIEGVPQTLALPKQVIPPENKVDGFINLKENKLKEYYEEVGFSFTFLDLKFIQEYFIKEKRDPYFVELKALDTYWSDHCRHTTFYTKLESIKIESENKRISDAFDLYNQLYIKHNAERADKYICLMDIATIAVKEMKHRGLLTNLDESDEVNACTIIEKVSIKEACGKVREEDYLLLFKNETHNHPTEIEPFGGAATCLGGAIRDVLAARGYVYQAMRLTGAGDVLAPLEQTMKGKLPQSLITSVAAEGFSSYGNQIGLATGLVSEVYHPNFVAKRMEVGYVVGAVPLKQVRREKPAKSDKIILIGGRTGRDGVGGATGSSIEHTEQSVAKAGAEVQKGNAPEERKLQRLFLNPDFTKLIKKCNDFGAGGVTVAIGEIADSLKIDLDKIPKKYEGLTGKELALSESQERMAIVVDSKDAKKVLQLAEEENLEAVVVGEVTDTGRMQMFVTNSVTGKQEKIIDLSREFLDTAGVVQTARAVITDEISDYLDNVNEAIKVLIVAKDYKAAIERELKRLNVTSQRGMGEMFDSTITASTLLLPYGGASQTTPSIAMASTIPFIDTDTATISAYGYNPHLAMSSPFLGGLYSVVSAMSKLVASGVCKSRVTLSMQEYFERLKREPKKWGKPVSALLGALLAKVNLNLAAIGGKDSMSGTYKEYDEVTGSYKEIDVPPTVITFGFGVGDKNNIITNVLREAGKKLYLLPLKRDEFWVPDFAYLNNLYEQVHKNIVSKNVGVATVTGEGGAAIAVIKSCLGNSLGFDFSNISASLFKPYLADIIIQADDISLLEGVEALFLGQTTADGRISVGQTSISTANALSSFESTLSTLFPLDVPPKDKGDKGGKAEKADGRERISAENISFEAKAPFVAKSKVASPKVLIPVFPGTNCEIDTARAFEKAGASVDIYVVKNMPSNLQAGGVRLDNSGLRIKQSIENLAKLIDSANIIAFPGGFSGGDEPEGSGKFIAGLFRNPMLKDKLHNFLQNKDGLIIGICNGFQALVKLGLLPDSEIKPLTANSPTLTFNDIGKHMSNIVNVRVASNNSPWFSGVSVGDVFSVPISHGEGKFVADDKTIKALIKNGQIATQYVEPKTIGLGAGQGRALANGQGNVEHIASMRHPFNPNGSRMAIEGIFSKCGRILGKMGHSERIGDGLYKNFDGNFDMKIFESGVKYFR
ncbi:MAG: phosphoribosylformylglycinamidine synthase [Firmicutes bacterium]|nr:phosphoribosylformylglycinamidine synthase [Bacillota bacterium]